MLLLEIGWPLLSCQSIDKLMLIIFHYLSYFNLQFTLNMMIKFEFICIGNESEIASWNNFLSKQSVTLGN